MIAVGLSEFGCSMGKNMEEIFANSMTTQHAVM
jgi:hypothetical protein